LADQFVPRVRRRTRQRIAVQDFLIRLAHGVSKPAFAPVGKRRFYRKTGLAKFFGRDYIPRSFSIRS
jgi:hypothetical protein